MNKRLGLGLVLSTVTGFFIALVATNLICGMHFCGPNRVNHYFCDMAPVKVSLHRHSCKRTSSVQPQHPGNHGAFSANSHILWLHQHTILKIPSAEGRGKHLPPVPHTSPWSLSTMAVPPSYTFGPSPSLLQTKTSWWQ